MRRTALFAVAVLGVTASLGSGCPRKGPSKTNPEPQNESLTQAGVSDGPVAVQGLDECQGLRIMKRLDDTKSQSFAYRGGMLDAVKYVENIPDGGTPFQRMQATILLPNGSLATAPITLEEKFRDVHNPIRKDLPVYEVSLCRDNPCANEEYDAVPEENLPPDARAEFTNRALLVPGYWENGAWKLRKSDGQPVFTLSCFTGAVAKCVHWGYVPGVKDNAGTDLTPFYQACVHASRARYVKHKDDSFTCSATNVEIYDQRNLLKRRSPSNKARFESLWNENGLVCMAHSRWNNCEREFAAAGIKLDPNCSDPVPNVGGLWPDGGVPDGGIIAIASHPNGYTAATGCPNLIVKNEECQDTTQK